MVDYSAALPQQQNFQAPDLMQNAMRMQQMQVQNAQMQEMMRTRQEQAALRGIPHDPNSPEFAKQAFLINPELGIKVIGMQRQNALLEQQTRAAGLSATKTEQDIQSGHIDFIRKFNDEIPGILASDNPAAAYDNWRARLKSVAPESNVPETFPGAKALSGYADKASEFLTRNKPQLTEVGGAKVEYTPNGGLRELNVTPSMAGSADANVGPATAAMNPDRLAAMQATQARLGLPPMQPSAAGANAAVNNMPGAAPIQPPVGNAMAASPSPYGAPIGAGAFAQQQKAQEDQRVLALELAKKRGEAQVAQEQALPKAKSEDIAKREVGFEKATTNVRTAAQELDEQIRLVNELRTHPGLTNITGTLYGRTPNLSQSAVNAQSLLDTVKEKGKLTALLNLKEAGGTLGQVSNAEGEGLRQSIAPLAQRQDTETFQRRLNDYAAKLTAAKAKLTGAYEDTYAYKGAKAPASSFTVADPTGKVHTFLSQQAADQFKQAAGL